MAIDPAAAFTDEELARLVATSDVIGLDVGELDVLRDSADGRIYVIDINKTPFGPPAAMSWPASRRAARVLAEAYRDYLAGRDQKGTSDGDIHLPHRTQRRPNSSSQKTRGTPDPCR